VNVPDLELDAHVVVEISQEILEGIQDRDRAHACAGAALTAFLLFRGSRTLDADMDLLEEFFSWMSAHSAGDEGQHN
jgi:hypothetical protein